VKSLTVLWNKIAKELAVRCCTSAHQDYKYVLDRTKHEGLSFLTITLPTFAKDFEYCLEQGKVDNTVFLSFRKNGSLPAFLRGFSCLVFDRRTGVLLDNPDLGAIYAVRQLTLLFSKILLDCEQHRIDAAFQDFLECEKEVRSLYQKRSHSDFQRMSTLLFGQMFSDIDREVYEGRISPKHGPGSTADGLLGNQKFRQMSWPCRLERYFPYVDMVLPSRTWFDVMDEVDFLEPGRELPVKVIHVPKTMKTPRIIAVEPTAMQYAQQGILALIQDAIKGSYLDGFIGLDDQGPNQLLARQGSLHGDLATLDLSEASDRVSCETVSYMLRRHRHFHDAVLDCRSRRARLPSGEVIPLAKFASMGSALCFPMEAMVFLVAIFLGIEEDLGRPLTKSDIKSYLGRVRVYGDDIIVPVDHVRSVISSLEYFGLKVNSRKSFWNGKFRESCGREFYAGSDVSVVRVRRVIPSSRKDVQEIVSADSLRNQLFRIGLEDAAFHLDSKMLELLGHYPYHGEDSPVLGRFTWDPDLLDLQVRNGIPLIKGWLIRSKIPFNEIDDWPALRKCLASMEKRGDRGPLEVLATSRDHLRRSGRPRVVDIKLGMGPPGN